MFSKTGLLLSLLGLSTVLAAPVDQETRLEDIQCRCLSFSDSAKPSLCTYLESHGLDWHTAYTLATDHDLKIQFASRTTISKVLSIPRPLPTSVLRSLSEGEVLSVEADQTGMSENKIVCGLDDEVKHLGSEINGDEPELHYVGVVVGSFMMLLILYVVGDYFLTK